MVMAHEQSELPHELREFTLKDLRRVRVQDGRIDAYGLIAVAFGVTARKTQKKLLADCLQKCPVINKHWGKADFGRVNQAPALTAKGSFRLICSHSNCIAKIENACLVVGTHILKDANDARELFEKVCLGANREIESGESEDDHEACLKAQARDTAMMTNMTATVQAVTQAMQLQKELGMTANSSLQSLAREKVKEVEELASQQGVLDAMEILKRFNHTDSEAQHMGV